MAQLRRPRTAITHQKLRNPGTSVSSDPADLVASDRNNPVTLTVEEMEVLLLIRGDLLKKKDMKTKVKKGTFPAKTEMARLTRRPENKFKEIYGQLQEKSILSIEDNNRYYQVGKNSANAFAFIRDHFTNDDKKLIEKYFFYSREKRQNTLSMKKTSPHLKTEELEELAYIAGQLPILMFSHVDSEQTARLAEIEHAKKNRLVKGEEVDLIPFEHAYRRFQDEQIMDSLNKLYQQAESSHLAHKELAANICRVLGRDPKNLELSVQPRQADLDPVQPLNAPSQQVTTEIPATEQKPITGFADTLQHHEEPKEQIRKRFANRVKRTVSTTWTTLTPFLNKKRVAKQANQDGKEMRSR